MNIPDEFPLELTGLISLLSKGFSRVFSSTTIQRHQFFSGQASLMVQLSHVYMTTGKTIALTIQAFVSKVMSLLFNMLSTFVLALLPRSKLYMLISKIINLYANLGNHLGRKESDMTEQRN